MNKELKIGLLALVAGVMLYSGFNFLKGTDFFSSTRTYYILYDNIEGLTISNPVIYNGLPVGRVSSIQILHQRNGLMLVGVSIRKDLSIYNNTKAVLGSSGLLGGKAIVLEFPKDKKGKLLEHGDTLIASKEIGMMAMVTEKAQPLLNKTDSIMHKVNILLGSLQGAGQKIDAILTDFRQIGATTKNLLQANQDNLNAMFANFAQLSKSLKETEKSLKPLLTKADTFVTKLNKLELQNTVQNANQSIKQLNLLIEKVNKGEGSAGALINDKTLYQNINQSTESLNKLMTDFRESPQRYVNISVFGKKNKEKDKK
ncbi:MAG: MlaD family protein [Microscillaceae bacterium]|nr:MlaD family protein [Microscillaceae bacterium]MDW8461262.1 MlaD family protein [Cytophagales bacterium]